MPGKLGISGQMCMINPASSWQQLALIAESVLV